MTTPIAAPLVPVAPGLRPGKADATGLEGFAALLGQLVTAVAGTPDPGTPTATGVGTPPTWTAPDGSCPDSRPETGEGVDPLVAQLLPEAVLAACVAPPLPLAATGGVDVAGAKVAEAASPAAEAAVLRHGPPASPPGLRDRVLPEGAQAAFAAVAERGAMAPVVPGARIEADVTAVPAPGTEGAVATAPAAPPAPVAAEPAVERTEGVRPAIAEAARGLRQEGEGRVSLVVRLNPPELGSVLVKLTVQDGRVDVQLRTPDLQAVGDLNAQAREVQQVLKESGFDLSSFDVSHGGVRDDEHSDGKTPDRGTTQRDRRADGRDETAHVTDDVPEARPAGTWL